MKLKNIINYHDFVNALRKLGIPVLIVYFRFNFNYWEPNHLSYLQCFCSIYSLRNSCNVSFWAACSSSFSCFVWC